MEAVPERMEAGETLLPCSGNLNILNIIDKSKAPKHKSLKVGLHLIPFCTLTLNKAIFWIFII